MRPLHEIYLSALTNAAPMPWTLDQCNDHVARCIQQRQEVSRDAVSEISRRDEAIFS